jgi:hypothetical protein
MTGYEATRHGLHAVAERLLAGPQYRATGTVRLRQLAGGFGTVRPYGDVLLVTVDGTELVVSRVDGGADRHPLRGTLGELAAATGLEYGGPDGVYADGSGATPDLALDLDADAAAVLADAFATGAAALDALGDPVIWPEHFDIAVTVDEVNYGVSPGDAAIAEPYAYVGPHRPRTGPFWNQSFGAAHPLRELPDVAAFFAEGRRLTAGE